VVDFAARNIDDPVAPLGENADLGRAPAPADGQAGSLPEAEACACFEIKGSALPLAQRTQRGQSVRRWVMRPETGAPGARR
jgi:hypothetical protein